MSKTITLPDHISFEEIAAKWCAADWLPQLKKLGNDWLFFTNLIYFTPLQEMKFYLQEFTLGDSKWELENQMAIACFNKNSRHLEVFPHSSFLFQPILDFIKERSNV